jgi:hypothetical protein
MTHCLDDRCKNGCIAYEIAFGSRSCDCGRGCNCKVSCNDATIELEDRDCNVLLRASYERGEYFVSVEPTDYLLRRHLNKSARLFDRNFSVTINDIDRRVSNGEFCDHPDWNRVPTLEIVRSAVSMKVSVSRASYVNIEIGTLDDCYGWLYSLAFDQETWEAIVSFVDRRLMEELKKGEP